MSRSAPVADWTRQAGTGCGVAWGEHVAWAEPGGGAWAGPLRNLLLPDPLHLEGPLVAPFFLGDFILRLQWHLCLMAPS